MKHYRPYILQNVALVAALATTTDFHNSEVVDFDDIDSLLDADIGTIEDLPDYIVPPPGMYKCVVKKMDKKGEQKGKRCVKFTAAVVETIQLENNAQEQPKAGSLFGQNWFPDTSVEKPHMWRWLKKVIKPYQEAIGATTLGQAMDAMEGQMVIVVTGIKVNDDKTQTYVDIKKILPAA